MMISNKWNNINHNFNIFTNSLSFLAFEAFIISLWTTSLLAGMNLRNGISAVTSSKSPYDIRFYALYNGVITGFGGSTGTTYFPFLGGGLTGLVSFAGGGYGASGGSSSGK